MQYPTLSVTMSNYNHAHYLPIALDAILSQSYQPHELLIIDDASTDNSVAVLESYAAKYNIIRLIRNEKNLGGITNVNRQLEYTTSDYVYSAAADDKILPGFFEKTMKALTEHPHAVICCSDPVFFEDKTGKTNGQKLLNLNERRYFTPDEIVKIIARKNFWIAGHTSIVSRKAILSVGGYLEDLKWHCDWFACLVLAFRYGACYIPEPLASMRLLQTSYSTSGSNRWEEQREVIYNIVKYLISPEFSDILPAFQRSGVMRIFGTKFLRTCMHYSELWDLDTFKLIPPKIFKNILYDAVTMIRALRM